MSETQWGEFPFPCTLCSHLHLAQVSVKPHHSAHFCTRDNEYLHQMQGSGLSGPVAMYNSMREWALILQSNPYEQSLPLCRAPLKPTARSACMDLIAKLGPLVSTFLNFTVAIATYPKKLNAKFHLNYPNRGS